MARYEVSIPDGACISLATRVSPRRSAAARDGRNRLRGPSSCVARNRAGRGRHGV